MKFEVAYTCYRHSGQFVANGSVKFEADWVDWAELVNCIRKKLKDCGTDTCDLIIVPTAIIPKPDIRENSGLGAKFYFAVIKSVLVFVEYDYGVGGSRYFVRHCRHRGIIYVDGLLLGEECRYHFCQRSFARPHWSEEIKDGKPTRSCRIGHNIVE